MQNKMKPSLFIGIVLTSLLVVPILATGQIENPDDTAMFSGDLSPVVEMIEKSAEVLEMDHDFSILAEDLADPASKPLNLNTAKEEELNTIPFLTSEQRKGLLNYLTTYGEVLSVFELQSIPGFDSVLIQKISPFISISAPSHLPAFNPKNLIRFGHQDLLLRYEQAFPKSAGYLKNDTAITLPADEYYPGSPQRYYFRYRYSWFEKLRIGFAGEKDPGEQFFRGAQANGMDFYAGYLSLSNVGILKNLVIGNFRVSYGQGLTMGSGLSLSSVPGFATAIPMAAGIRPGLGMNETSYLRGLASTIKIKHIEFSGFASFHSRDATVILSDTTSSQAEEISSISGTGYHRTPSELARRNAMTELAGGGNVSFSMAPNQQLGFKIGLTGLYVRYSTSLIPKIYPYNQFGFRGKENLNTGFDLQIRYHGIYVFGELSRSCNGGFAWLAGTSLAPDPRVSVTVICRNYQYTYQNLFSNAFGQNSLNANEQGLYAAINMSVHPRVNISGYIDLYQFPWLKYRVDAPSSGQESGMILGWQASRNVMIHLRFYQKKTRMNNTAEPDQIMHQLGDNLTKSYRMGMEWIAVNGINLKTRIEVKEAGGSETYHPFGYLVFQEAQIRVLKWPEIFTLRFALFDVPGYSSRIYVYEPEVLYGYSVPAYQGRGMRTCLVLKFGFGRKADFWLRGGITCYSDRNEIGTGPDLTKGNVRTELTGQLLIRL